jgi:hypothetical protein
MVKMAARVGSPINAARLAILGSPRMFHASLKHQSRSIALDPAVRIKEARVDGRDHDVEVKA